MRGFNIVAWGATFAAVVFAWIPFRAETTTGALELLRSMLLLDGLDVPVHLHERLEGAGLAPSVLGAVGQTLAVGLPFAVAIISASLAIAVACPSTTEICGIETGSGARRRWWVTPRPWPAAVVGVLLAYALLSTGQPSEFLYFNF